MRPILILKELLNGRMRPNVNSQKSNNRLSLNEPPEDFDWRTKGTTKKCYLCNNILLNRIIIKV